jgi:hypothetical protein
MANTNNPLGIDIIYQDLRNLRRKRQAVTSGKLQATSSKRQAPSNKQQASSRKRQAL